MGGKYTYENSIILNIFVRIGNFKFWFYQFFVRTIFQYKPDRREVFGKAKKRTSLAYASVYTNTEGNRAAWSGSASPRRVLPQNQQRMNAKSRMKVCETKHLGSTWTFSPPPLVLNSCPTLPALELFSCWAWRGCL